MLTPDKLALIQALLDVHYFGTSKDKTKIDKLKKSKHLTAAGKISNTGMKFIERYYARGADRNTLAKELG